MHHHSPKHIALCLGSAALAVILGSVGAGLWVVIPVAVCAVTCAQMIVSMIRSGHDKATAQ